MAVSFDAAFNPGQLRIVEQFSPMAQIKAPLMLLWRKFDGQRSHWWNTTAAAPEKQLTPTCSSIKSDSTMPLIRDLSAISDNRDFYAVDRGQRVEQALPFLAAFAPNPELSGGGPEIERG